MNDSALEGALAIVRTPAPKVTSKQRRDYTARELEAMAVNAREGIPPAGSVADHDIRRAELSGDFERALALRAEVKERAPDLARMARAQRRAEKRAQKRADKWAT